jgi:protease-4
MSDKESTSAAPAEAELEESVGRINDHIANEVILEYLKEQRVDRRWKTVRRVFIAMMIVSGLVLYAGTLAGSLGYRTLPSNDAVAVVPISGVISQGSAASAESVITVLERMFATDNVKGIVLLIDSGGGSPTEAERITRFIDKEQERTGKPVYAVCGSMCASAAYMIAIHADRIYAGEYSWTGSIGAIMKGWDAHRLMEKFDLGQRVFASGPLKDLMNPFTDMSQEMESKLGTLVNQTADTFSAEVTSMRGEALVQDRNLFTGEVWTGKESLELGLIDEIGTVEMVLDERFTGLPHHVYRPKERGNTLFDRLLGNVGRGIGEALMDSQEGVQL